MGDVTVVITRYFGGTLLGTGGLVRAYGDAVRAVLEQLPRAEKVERRSVLLTIPYAQYEQVKRLVETYGGSVESEDFAVDITLILQFAVDDLPSFAAALNDLMAGQVEIKDEG